MCTEKKRSTCGSVIQPLTGCRKTPVCNATAWTSVNTARSSIRVEFHCLTTAANSVVGAIHDRMPVIVPREKIGTWLDFETPAKVIDGMLGPYPPETMESLAVGQALNKATNEGPWLLEEVGR